MLARSAVTYGARTPVPEDRLRSTLRPWLSVPLVLAAACTGPAVSERFCELAQENSGEVEASYVGSEEHVAALDQLVAAAPDDIADELATVRDHIRDGVRTADPASKDIANYPDEVREAVQASDDFIATECDVDMTP